MEGLWRVFGGFLMVLEGVLEGFGGFEGLEGFWRVFEGFWRVFEGF